MAVEAEQDIMRAIGFGQHFSWHNGGGCRSTRIAAIGKLPNALRAAGMKANPDLMKLAEAVAYRGEDSDYVLTKTWVVCAEIIQLHLYRKAGMSREDFRDAVADMERRHMPRPKVWADGTMR